MQPLKLAKIEFAYIAIQVAIWSKCSVFFLLFGHGKVLPFNVSAFPKSALFFDWIFHALGHFAIGVLALLYGFSLKEFRLLHIVPRVFAAVLLHNVAYWFTYSHPTVLYSAVDFGSDSAILLSAVFAGFILGKWKRN